MRTILIFKALFMALLASMPESKAAPQTPSEIKEDFEMLKKGAEDGDATAQYLFGAAHALGHGVAPDRRTALNWYIKAANQGLPMAIHEVAVYYDQGLVVERNTARAIALYTRAADAGFPKSQVVLADRHQWGNGVEKDQAKSLRLYLMAAKQGSAEGMDGAAGAYYWGWGTAIDYRASFEWSMKAAMLGKPDSQYRLGLQFSRGEGIPKDEIEAYAWFNLAATAGNTIGREELEKKLSPDGRLRGQQRTKELMRAIAKNISEVRESQK